MVEEAGAFAGVSSLGADDDPSNESIPVEPSSSSVVEFPIDGASSIPPIRVAVARTETRPMGNGVHRWPGSRRNYVGTEANGRLWPADNL